MGVRAKVGSPSRGGVLVSAADSAFDGGMDCPPAPARQGGRPMWALGERGRPDMLSYGAARDDDGKRLHRRCRVLIREVAHALDQMRTDQKGGGFTFAKSGRSGESPLRTWRAPGQ